MELLNISNARAVWLLDISELNPRGKAVLSELLEWIADEYHFEKSPKSVTDLDETKALTFSRGEFQVEEEIFVDVELKIFNDGLVVNTWSSTRHAEAFLENVVKSAVEEFNLTFKPHTVRRKMYVSELYVRTDKDSLALNPMLAQLADKIAAQLPANIRLPYEVFGVTVAPIQSVSSFSIAPFRFERKLNTRPDEHKFYSTAPIHTDEHLKLLEWFEQEFMR